MASPPPAFDAGHVSPGDALVTVRSLRRRFAEAFDLASEPGDLALPGAGSGLSPVQHAAWTATALEAIDAALHQVMVADNPEITLPPVDPEHPAEAPAPAAALARLGDVARSLADAMAEIHGEAWTRTGRTPAGERSALDIARLGVRIGVEHLRAAEQAIRTASH